MTAPHRIDHETRDGIAALTLVAPEAGVTATFVPAAGMVGASLTRDGDELLGKTDLLPAYRAAGHTFGIPLLHPWANRLAAFGYEREGHRVVLPPDSPKLHYDEHGLPIHGIPGPVNPDWTVTEEHADGAHARIAARLEFSPDDELLAFFPFPHTVDVAVTLRDTELTVHTTVLASGPTAVPVSLGFHPYFRLPGVPRADWHVTLPARRHLLLDDHSIPTGATDLDPVYDRALGTDTFDDAYDRLGADPEFVLRGGAHRIAVRFGAGFPVAQVYAPGGGDDVVCFEPMTAPVNALRSGVSLPVLAPDETFTAAFTVTVTGEEG